MARIEKPGPRKGLAYGAAGFAQQLSGVHFPQSKQQLINMIGNKTFEVEKGRQIQMSQILKKLPDRQYNNPADIMAEAEQYIQEA